MPIFKTTVLAASIALAAGSSAFAQTYKSRTNADARAAYAAQFAGSGYHTGNIASDTTREGLVMTNQ